MVVWYLVIVLTVPILNDERIEKIFVDRFSSKEICESWIPIAKEQINIKTGKIVGAECRPDEIVSKKPKHKEAPK